MIGDLLDYAPLPISSGYGHGGWRGAARTTVVDGDEDKKSIRNGAAGDCLHFSVRHKGECPPRANGSGHDAGKFGRTG
jgi:hypothetical protein